MIRSIFQNAALLDLRRRQVIAILAFQLAGVGMELAGIFSLLPVIQFIMAKGDVAGLVADHRYWAIMRDVYRAVGLPMSLPALLTISFLFVLMRQLFVFIRLRYEASLRQRVTAQTRFKVFRNFLHARLEAQEQDSAGTIVNDMTTELDRAVSYLFLRVMFLGVLGTLLVYAAGLLLLSTMMTLVALGLFFCAGLLLRGQIRQSGEVGKTVTAANKRMSAYLVERLKQARLIRLAGLEKVEVQEMASLTDQQRRSMTRQFHLLANVEVMVEPIIIATGFVFLYVAVGIFGMPFEDVGIFLLILLRLLPVMKQLAKTRHNVVSFAASYAAIRARLTALSAAAEDTGGTLILEKRPPQLRFEAVTFQYNNSLAEEHAARPPNAALRGLDLTVPAGKVTAIVGPSGAGKSTLFDLIPRLRRLDQGKILLNDQPLDLFALQSLRNDIAYVPQQSQVFDVTVADHIRFGKPEASMEDIIAAARQAHAHGFIEDLPQGYNTRLGDGGGRLSGGQRQRLDLARALVRKAPILLLDEPTASLDAESEAGFQEALGRVRAAQKTTIIIIAHRLSTVASADLIVVLQDGSLIAEGRHDDLMRQGGWYAEAFRKQKADR